MSCWLLVGLLKLTDPADLCQQICHRRVIKVPLQQGGENPIIFISISQYLPHFFDHCGTMGINNEVFGFIVVTGNMNVGNAVGG